MKLEAIKLHKYYNSRHKRLHVLNGINLKAQSGELVSIIGASGAGKSTLLHLLAGIDVPSEGEVLLDGKNIYKIKEGQRARLRNRMIGFVFQFYHLLPEFTALENVMLPGFIQGQAAKVIKKKAADLLKQVGLEKRGAHHPAELSGGEQQRVAIARALINQPQILFCDEPTGNLDSKTGAKICELLLSLNKEGGYTIVVATHSQEIAKVAGRRIFIKDGQLINN